VLHAVALAIVLCRREKKRESLDDNTATTIEQTPYRCSIVDNAPVTIVRNEALVLPALNNDATSNTGVESCNNDYNERSQFQTTTI
jgi:hypothetical protein